MVAYVVGRFGFFGMERLEGNLTICDAWHLVYSYVMAAM